MTHPSSTDEARAREMLALIRHVRNMTRAENTHARALRRDQIAGRYEGASTSRDDVDMIHANLYDDWPAKRLDSLAASIRAMLAFTAEKLRDRDGEVERSQDCSCAEVAGEDPRCWRHGEGTRWSKENPDICELAERLAEYKALSTPQDPAPTEAQPIPAGMKAEVEQLTADFKQLHDAARGCEFDLTPADGAIAKLVLFVHENGERILEALATPKPSPPDQAEERVSDEVALPWANVGELTQWIENTRWKAFRDGARHEDISRVEATLLLATLASPDPTDQAERG